MELFDELIVADNIWDAQIVGKNIFCQNPADTKHFKAYFDFCLKVANWPVEIDTRTFFFSEAELSLQIYSERCVINKQILEAIKEYRSQLNIVSDSINKSIQDETSKQERKTNELNNSVLGELSQLKSEMIMARGKSEFDSILPKISSLEEELEKESLTDCQKDLYNQLTRDFSLIISQKMAEISQIDDTAYNKLAAESFKKAFDLFKCQEDRYKKSDSELYELVSKYLFSYDAKRLFNECLVYYNHVYSYIFNKLDDAGKYRFTQYSFDTPKNG